MCGKEERGWMESKFSIYLLLLASVYKHWLPDEACLS